VAGGQAIVQAALQAVWQDRSLLESLVVPQAVLDVAAAEAARAPGSGSAAAGKDVGTSRSSDSNEQQQQQQQHQEDVEQQEEESDSEQGSGFVDDYLKAPAVTTAVRPTVVYVTVPALPRG
jgi:hypothetical protein